VISQVEIDGSNFKIKESAHFSFLFRKKKNNEKGRSAVESLKSKHEMKWKHSESEKTGKKILTKAVKEEKR